MFQTLIGTVKSGSVTAAKLAPVRFQTLIGTVKRGGILQVIPPLRERFKPS